MNIIKRKTYLLLIALTVSTILLARCSSNSEQLNQPDSSNQRSVPPQNIVSMSILDSSIHHFTCPPNPNRVDYFITDPDTITTLLNSIDWSDTHYFSNFARHEIYVYMKKSDGTVRRWALQATLDYLTDLDDPDYASYDTWSLRSEELWQSLAQ